MTWNDKTRMAFMEMVRWIFPVLIILGIAHFSDSDTAALTAAIGSMVSFLGLLFKKGQAAG